jgi:hypothetical protein
VWPRRGSLLVLQLRLLLICLALLALERAAAHLLRCHGSCHPIDAIKAAPPVLVCREVCGAG